MSNNRNKAQRRIMVAVRLKPADVDFLSMVNENRTRAVEACIEAMKNGGEKVDELSRE